MSINDATYFLREAVQRNADGVAARTLTVDGQQVASEMSWAQLEKQVGKLSRFLENLPALRPGDRLGVLGRNSVEYLQLMYACAEAGIIMVPLNTRWAVNELRHGVIDSGIKVMAILDREYLGVTLELSATSAADPGLAWLVVGPLALNSSLAPDTRSEVLQWRFFALDAADRVGDTRETGGWAAINDARGGLSVALASPRNQGHERLVDGPVCDNPEQGEGRAALKSEDTRDVFCIVHTSGSTGRSKGVALTHLGQIFQAYAKCNHLGYTSSTVYLNVLPLCHVGGISSALAVTLVGGCQVFVPKFTPACGSAAVRAGRVNTIVVVPTMLHMLIKGEGSKSHGAGSSSLAAVDTVVVGGQIMSRRLELLARDCMPSARFVQTYACTEAGSTITFASHPCLVDDAPPGASGAGLRLGSSGGNGTKDTTAEKVHGLWTLGGTPPDHVEVRVVARPTDSNHSPSLAAAGAIGEVETRGPHVMKGYWKRPDLTAEVLRPGGWLRTGDLGRLDERTGRLVVVGRAKDVIKTGGEKVHSSEVESVLLRHVWVAEAAAYGVDDERLGEKVAASVVLDDAAHDDDGAITRERARKVLDEFCGLHLSHYKRPRRIDVVPELPRNSAGKVLRHMLRASL